MERRRTPLSPEERVALSPEEREVVWRDGDKKRQEEEGSAAGGWWRWSVWNSFPTKSPWIYAGGE